MAVRRRCRAIGPRVLRGFEVTLTAGLALLLAVFGVFDVVDPDAVAAATLATLTLLVFGRARERANLSRVTALLDRAVETLRDRSTGGARFRRSTSGLDLEFGSATEVGLLGVTLGRTLRNNVETLTRLVADGALVRVAVIDPDSTAPAEAARRATMPDHLGIFTNRLRPTLDLLHEIEVATRPRRGRLEVRLLPFVPAFGMVVIDPGRDSGRLHLDVYSHRPAGPEPTLTLTPSSDALWFRHFCREFDHLWAHARPLDQPTRSAERISVG